MRLIHTLVALLTAATCLNGLTQVPIKQTFDDGTVVYSKVEFKNPDSSGSWSAQGTNSYLPGRAEAYEGVFTNGLKAGTMVVDKDGTISIGATNIFQGMDIGITRIVDRDGLRKAFINIAGVDTWPNWTKATEWWVNAGPSDGVMDLSWLDSKGTTRDFVFSVGENDQIFYFKSQRDKIDKFRLDGATGNIKTSGYISTGGDTNRWVFKGVVPGGVLVNVNGKDIVLQTK